MAMNVKFRWPYALYLVAVLSIFLINIFVFEHTNLLKLSINTLIAIFIGLFIYPISIRNGSWVGFAKGIMIFIVTYLLFWHLLGQLSDKDITRIISLSITAAICFRPTDHSWRSALTMVGWLFGLTATYYLFDTIWYRIF